MIWVTLAFAVLLGIAVCYAIWKIPATPAGLTVQQLPRLEPGDVLHVKLGMYMNDGLPPWLPTSDDMEATKQDFEAVLPKDVHTVVTHFGVSTNTILLAHPELKEQSNA